LHTYLGALTLQVACSSTKNYNHISHLSSSSSHSISVIIWTHKHVLGSFLAFYSVFLFSFMFQSLHLLPSLLLFGAYHLWSFSIGSFHLFSNLIGSFAFLHLLIGSIDKKWNFHVSLEFGASFGEFLKHRTLIHFYKSASSFSNSSWFHKMSKNHLYFAIGIISCGIMSLGFFLFVFWVVLHF